MEQRRREENRRILKHYQWIAIYLVIYDMFAVSFAYFGALWLRFDLRFSMIPAEYLHSWAKMAPFYAVFCIIVFGLLRLYKSIWRFASFKELQRVLQATAITTIVHILAITIILMRMPCSYYIVGAILQFLMIVGIRFLYRFINLLRAKDEKSPENSLLIGAGKAGAMVLREMHRAGEVSERFVCIIDDNSNKWKRDIDGIPVVGGREMILEAVEKYKISKIYMAIPSAPEKEKKAILEICKETDCELKTLPGMYQLMLGEVTVNKLRNVEIEDLLGREPVRLDFREMEQYFHGKTVLVTGGGGSIGSELCRQLAALGGIKKLVIFDVYENNAHAIKLELMDEYPELDFVTLIGSVRNIGRIKQVLEEYKPDIIFHAAAHKHVPLMENSPCESIKTNVMGTYFIAYAAMAYNCEKFVLISTDKAVNPVNIMGASKRLCEMIIQSFDRRIRKGKITDIAELDIRSDTDKSLCQMFTVPDKPKTEFVAVRFGNVLGSNGSVIPRFREQIAKGGPVTVTHPDIVRYFMTIPEAISLVITAATFGGGGNIFVLDMGTPVKIDDLARNMIKLSGLKPDEDIEVIYTGLRPGEKLYEERLMDEEGLQSTSNDLISIGQPLLFDEDKFIEELPELFGAAYEECSDIRERVARIVETYRLEKQ